MKEENYTDNFYEEYRGHVIASSKGTGTDESTGTVITVYEKSNFPEFAFIIGAGYSKDLEPKEDLMGKVNEARSYVDSRCCERLKRGDEIPDSALPIYLLEGTEFYVDVTRFQLMEKLNSHNVIPFSKMEDYGDCYRFDYNRTLKNIPEYPNRRDKEIEIPEFVVMAPEGMARKYGITIDEVKKKTDFDFMVNQMEFDLRVKKGKLPTLDIAGHIFYVDMQMDKLRPKDDFGSYGISFNEIEEYFSEDRGSYLIPYDPKKREFRELDYENITSIPKDLIVIEFPFQQVLDPVGWNRQGGWGLKEDLKHIELKGHFTAKVVDWKQTFIVDIIKDNLERMKPKEGKKEIKEEPKKSKGRKR
ncbi:MAG: hypothetical protein JNM21_14670 [Taibaiella sp.]|nr:hypothetical protein [Taibaiella sp.]